jgi:Pilus formation protein N terminal region
MRHSYPGAEIVTEDSPLSGKTGVQIANRSCVILRNSMMKNGVLSVLAGVATVLAMAGQAQAGQPFVVGTDMTSLVTLSTEPATIAIGNPSIADVTLNGKQVFIHGHAFGDTNVILLDRAGNMIANFDVTVKYEVANMVSIFGKGQRWSFTCAPYCESVMIPGDNFTYTSTMLTLNQQKNQFATGKISAEAAAPAAPQ